MANTRISTQIVEISHWLPIITFCPVNNLPDLLYVTVTFDHFKELYEVRRRIRQLIAFRKMYMEDVAESVFKLFNECVSVQVRLVGSKHIVHITAAHN